LRQIALRSAGITGGTLDVQLAIANPNHIEVTGTSLTAGLDLQGQHFGDIASNNLFTLADQDTTLVTLPLSFRWADVGSAAKNILGYGEVNYHLAGNIGVKLPAGQEFTVPFTGDGSVPLLRSVTTP
jgi:LEA14-like dessication related protein